MPSYPLPRLIAIIRCLSYKKSCGLAAIQFYLENREINVSNRTLERDFKRLRSNFNIDVVYNKNERAYQISQDTELNIKAFCELGEHFQSAKLLSTIMKGGMKDVKVIDLSSNGQLSGTDFLDQLFEAISGRYNLLIAYQAFDKDNAHSFDVSPWLLKFYAGRWYVVGEYEGNLRILGIDRIVNVERSKTRYHPYKGNPKDIFNNQVGIFYKSGPPVEVRFLATPRHAQYLNTLPMHNSQQHLGVKNKWELFSLKVTINLELVQQFLMAGNRVKVLSPNELVKEMKVEIKKMYDFYFNSDK